MAQFRALSHQSNSEPVPTSPQSGSGMSKESPNRLSPLRVHLDSDADPAPAASFCGLASRPAKEAATSGDPEVAKPKSGSVRRSRKRKAMPDSVTVKQRASTGTDPGKDGRLDIRIIDDGYRWRKYGRKNTKSSANPNFFYKCTHRGCSVRKRVQRCDDDPSTFNVTYNGTHTHTCPAIVKHQLLPSDPTSCPRLLSTSSLGKTVVNSSAAQQNHLVETSGSKISDARSVDVPIMHSSFFKSSSTELGVMYAKDAKEVKLKTGRWYIPEDSNQSQQAASDLSGLTQVSRDGLFGPEPRPECNLYSNPSEQAASGISGLTHASRDGVFGRETNLSYTHLTNERPKSQLCTSRNEAVTGADPEVVKQRSLSLIRSRHNMESGCPATELQQRCDADPSTFDATYQGKHTCQSVVQLIREVEDRHEDGYFLSSEWLLGLEQKQREFLITILSRAGYSETYHTGTTTLFERIENDVQNPTDSCNNPSSVVTESNLCNEDHQQVEGPKERDAVEGLDIDKRPGNAASQNSDYLPERSDEVHIPATALTVEDSSYVTDPVGASPMVKDQLVNLQLEERALGKCIRNSTGDVSQEPTTLNSFLSALKTNHLQSYAVNTAWLSHLEDHEKEELESTIWEAGYAKMNQESNTTTFERIRDDVELPPTNLCNNPTRTSDTPDVGASDRGVQEASGTGGLGRNDKLKGKSDEEDTRTEGYFGLATTGENGRTAGEDSVCHPQILKVTCSSLSHTATLPSISSSPAPTLRHFRRQQFGDCIVIMPRKGESRTISTTMEKPFSMTTVDFAGDNSTCNEVCVTLKAIATTTIGCCIRIDKNSRKLRIKFSKLHGDVRREGFKDQQCNALVLSSLRTNVYACISNGESEGESDEVILKLEDEYFVPPRRRIVGDHVWLKMSEISPDNCESGSITLELQGDVRKRLKADLAAQVRRAHVLHFQEPRPVTLEGDVPEALNPQLFLELNVRYQLEVSYIKPRTPISKEAMFVSGMRKSETIDFGCCLDFHVIEDRTYNSR